MKRLVILAALFLAPAFVQAQETYQLTAGAGNVTTLSAVITSRNAAICARAAQGPTCNQAQACSGIGVAGGASCTANQARAANARIYALSQPGREEFVTFEIALPTFLAMVAEMNAANRKTFCDGFTAATTTAKNNACSAIGLASGCDPCS